MSFPFLAEAPGGPRFRYRGLYVESKWGPDLMSLDDWRHLVDELAALRMNSLGVGVYGCWVVQYEGRRTEFLMVPFPEHPRLRTPQTIRWYSPAAGAEQTLTYLPRMFEEDFLGQVVAYGRERGVAVRPHFNGPGHTTLIPSVYPEVSARDAEGRPTGYGYCLSGRQTYDLLFSLYDSLIRRHLGPAGGEWWHLGLDEVEPSSGIDEDDPGRVVDPWCRCPDCAGQSKTRLLVTFAVRSVAHLVDQGMREITVWHDALARLDAYPLFKEELAARGLLERVAVQWWRYSDPPLAVGERPGGAGGGEGQPAEGAAGGLRAWVTPMAGYWSNLFHHEYGPNIQAMAAEGATAGAEGLDAYCIYDPASFRDYAWLAACGLSGPGGLDAFRAAYAAWLFEGCGSGPGGSPQGAPSCPPGARASPPGAPPPGAPGSRDPGGGPGAPPAGGAAGDDDVPPAFAHYDRLFDSSYGPLGTLLDALLPYWWTYPAQGGLRYPRDQVTQLAADPLRLGRALAAAQTQATELRDACRRAAPRAADGRRRRLLEEYGAEGHKLAGIVGAFRQAAAAWGHHRRARLGPARSETVESLTRAQAALAGARASVLDVLAELERVKAPYLRPHILRDLSPLYRWCAETHDRVRAWREQVEAGGLDEVPSL